MEYQIEELEEIIIVKLEWELWFTEVEKLKKVFEDLIKKEKDFIVNFSQVSYINSIAIWGFVEVYTNIRDAWKNLVVSEISTEVEEILELVWLDNLFTILKKDDDYAIRYLEEVQSWARATA